MTLTVTERPSTLKPLPARALQALNARTVPVSLAAPASPLGQDRAETSAASQPRPQHPILDLVAPARTVADSQARLPERIVRVIRERAAGTLHGWAGFERMDTKFDPGYKGPGDRGTYGIRANAMLRTGAHPEQVNQTLMTAKPYSNPGTNWLLTQRIGRRGDYDFTLTGLTAMAQSQWNNPLLQPAARRHLATTLLNQEGSQHLPSRWLLGIIPETENHILMTESARYLKNQLVQQHGTQFSTNNLPAREYNNQANGFNTWFVNHLSEFVRDDFDEYNSKPYQAYAIQAIQNLSDYATDPKVQTSAHVVMDYLSARFAVQSSDLRRSVAFRRRREHAGDDNLWADGQSSRYALLAGNYNGAPANGHDSGMGIAHMRAAALGNYRVPQALLDLMIDKGSNPYFARTHHRNTEIVYAERNFMISAGGHFQDYSRAPFTSQEDGIAMPTVVMLKDGGPLLSNMIRFLGRADEGGRANNTGVYENFAFGIRPTIPDAMLAEARRQGKAIETGPWTFLEVGGVYVAMHQQSQRSPKNYAPSVGFTEIVDRSEAVSLQAFADRVLQTNGNRNFGYYGANRYTTTHGKTIEFVMAEAPQGNRPPNPRVINEWLVKRVWDGNREIPVETRLDRWPLTDSRTMQPEQDGENNDYVMRADGTGQVLINNPRRNQSLLLSLADQENPIRIEQSGEAVNLTQQAQIRNAHQGTSIDTTVSLARDEHVRYLSLKWQAGSRPSRVRVYVQMAGETGWRLAEDRRTVHNSQDHAFRTDFDLSQTPQVRQVRFVAEGRGMTLLGNPDVFRGYRS